MLIKQYLEILLGFLAICGVIYRIAQTEQKVYESIDKVNDGLKEHIISCNANEQLTIYKLDQLSRQIDALAKSFSKG